MIKILILSLIIVLVTLITVTIINYMNYRKFIMHKKQQYDQILAEAMEESAKHVREILDEQARAKKTEQETDR